MSKKYISNFCVSFISLFLLLAYTHMYVVIAHTISYPAFPPPLKKSQKNNLSVLLHLFSLEETKPEKSGEWRVFYYYFYLLDEQ